MAREKHDSIFKTIVLSFFALILGFSVGFVGYGFITLPNDSDNYVFGDLKIHFLELGNKYAGDCIYIQCGDVDILVDAGSRANSIPTISNYLTSHMTDTKIEYAIVTHAHEDHIAGFAGSAGNPSLFRTFEFETIIDFPKTESTTAIYNRYVDELKDEVSAGAKHLTARDCIDSTNGGRPTFKLSASTTLNILNSFYYTYDASTENDYSVIFEIVQNGKKFLFTGDLEAAGEESFMEYYGETLTQVELFKAGHHGSPTSSGEPLLSKIQPKICVVTCVAGSDEYTDNILNQFPSQNFINNISKYTDKVYVTSEADESLDSGFKSMNGNIVVISDKNGVKVECSNNNKLLKDTSWFHSARSTPPDWQ